MKAFLKFTVNSNPVLRFAFLLSLLSAFVTSNVGELVNAKEPPPNILFAIADDWGWPHAGAYGDPVVKTPAFDRLAKEGILFHRAFVSSPSCTPSRGAILTGKYHWQLDAAANLYGTFPDRFLTYPDYLAKAGYQTGHCSKAWGPGQPETKSRHLGGDTYKNFADFFERRDTNKPFCFWLGSSDPHRPYQARSGVKSGMELAKIKLPACFPDAEVVRSDVADYYFEVQRFDHDVLQAIKLLEQADMLENTIIVMTGDHGMPFPRCKSNLYDSGTRVPLAIRWPKGISKPRETAAFVSLVDLAPTFLAAAQIEIPDEMTGRSLLPVFAGNDVDRDWIVFGKERHVPSQEAPDSGGYPCRAIRNDNFLYVRNYEPDRWPNGTPNHEQAFIPGGWYGDTDNGPTKSYMIDNRDLDANHRRLYELAFAKRPAVELYDLQNDPDQLINVAGQTKYSDIQIELVKQLDSALAATDDRRQRGEGRFFDEQPYSGGSPKFPQLKAEQR
jgi:arylsulfatase A-like enzyme